MLHKPMHPARRFFRSILLVFLGMSFAFFIMVVGLRVAYKDRGIKGPLQTAIFEFDVLQHHAWAAVSNDAQDMVIAERLMSYHIFSPIYSQAGLNMIRDKAIDGYVPAQERLVALYAPYEPPASVQGE